MREKPLILIVDDLKDNRLAIKIALKNENYTLIEAVNGEEAVTMCISLNPDIILMDVVMPVMNGFEATKKIRAIEKFSRTPILMVTALTDKEDKIKALESGVNDFVSKPFSKHELIARCKSYIQASNINEKYILASKNPSTNLPNRSALLDDIKLCKSPKLILFRIEDYEVLEEFYTEEIVENIEYKFSNKIFDLVSKECLTTTLYHISEGEFAFLRDDINNIVSSKNILKTCEKFYKNVKDDIIEIDDNQYDIDIILSFSCKSDNIFGNARIGLNHAIKEHKSIVFADEIIDEVHKEAENNIKIISTIKKALISNNIISFFQPLYNNETKKIEKYESLVRIIDEDLKTIAPIFFLEIAKQSNYYTKITEHVLQNSFSALSNTTKEISINISATDIEDEGTVNIIMNFLRENPDSASRIIFELLEDEHFKDFKIITKFINDVKKHGVKIAIDDFGSGYSNFERLLDYQPDILKIDGSLIKNIHVSKFSRNIVETIQSFADKMGIKTVAEFVSNEEIFKVVNEIGITYTQGYYIDEPKELDLCKVD